MTNLLVHQFVIGFLTSALTFNIARRWLQPGASFLVAILVTTLTSALIAFAFL